MLRTFCTFSGSCGSGYVGSVCFGIRIRYYLYESFHHQAKKVRKPWFLLWLLYDLWRLFFLLTGWGNGEMWTQSDVIQHPGRPLRGSFYIEDASYICHIFLQMCIWIRRIRMFLGSGSVIICTNPSVIKQKSKTEIQWLFLLGYWLGKWWNVNTEWCRTIWQTSTRQFLYLRCFVHFAHFPAVVDLDT